MFRSVFNIFRSCPKPPMLGRWNLKSNCPTEDIVVFNANRDHCGDQKEYRNMVPKKPVDIPGSDGNR